MKYLILFISFAVIANANDGVLMFKPFTASVFEPRIGSIINTTDENLRLDIGASFDLYRFEINSDFKMSMGTDFFTFTRLRSEENFKFPVETSDYFFGINSAAVFKAFNQNFTSRFRLAHISSHLVDGYSKDGIFFSEPFVYSREFTDLSIALNKKSGFIDYRIYSGFMYIFSTTPDDVNNITYYIGADFTKLLSKNIALVGGLDIRNGEVSRTNIAGQLGLNFKFFKDFGIFIGYYKYHGSSMHGMFYKDFDNYDGIGFQIIYF
ncbi:MAG: DUF1207 domain-containing protein [Candidatus Kapabacteria bacterium]|nr:DUF1207 domain-containing protein [Ignavibacteriota bacterium]MCW5885950.1 DUF1207 domain-containing protein [Candidatus Kapabacteria bacterium]